MTYQDNCVRISGGAVSRRTLVAGLAAGAGAIALGARDATAQTGPVAPPSTVTSPPRDFGPNGAPTTYFTDPDVLTIDPSFDGLRQPNAPIQRLWTGALWSEGPAWNSQGRYLVWSDIPNNRQMRWLGGRRSCQRVPHALEQQQRQHLRLPGPADLLRASHAARRPLRARRLDHRDRRQLQRQATQLSQRRGASSGRQHLVHRSALWRPALRGRARRGGRTEQCGGTPQSASLASRPDSSGYKRELPTNCYRWDPSGKLDIVVTEDQVPDPNGILFSPDYQEALRHQHRQGARRHRPRRQRRHLGLRRRRRQQALKPEALHRLRGRRREVRSGRHALRRGRQRLGARATPAAPSVTAA